MSQDSLTVTDNRTNHVYTLPIEKGTIRAMDLRQIKTNAEDFGLMAYDPAFMNTASCQSKITFIDGERGILEYRGYPIEVLAEHCSFLEVVYLLLFGDLPNETELKNWVYPDSLRLPIASLCKADPGPRSWTVAFASLAAKSQGHGAQRRLQSLLA